MRILHHPRVTLARIHSDPTHRRDNATAELNTVHQIFGVLAQNSAYGKAPPGSQTWVDVRVLRPILQLANFYSFSISELAGGSHGANSRHYAGLEIGRASWRDGG